MAELQPAVQRGLSQMLSRRRALVEAGQRPLGWKAAFGSPEAMQRLGLTTPLVGFLMEQGRLPSGAVVCVAGWVKPVVEPELAVYLGRDLGPGATASEVHEAVEAIGPALELADVDRDLTDLEAVLAGNVFHRHVVLGPASRWPGGARVDGLVGHVWRGASQTAVTQLEANTGPVAAVLAGMARALASAGETLRAGQVVITGSVVPPLVLTAQDTSVGFELAGIGRVDIRLQAAGPGHDRG